MLLLIFIASATQHGMDATAAEGCGNLWAFQRAQEVARGYAETSRLTFEHVAAGIRARQPEGPIPTLPKELEAVFGEGRNKIIVVNETTAARHAGSEQAVKETVGLNDEDMWQVHPELSTTGPCPICRPLDGTPRSYWGRFFPGGPPDPHVGCVCTIVYAFERELVEA